MQVTSAQIRAARGLLDISQSQLAETSSLSFDTIKRLERFPAKVSATRATIIVLLAALERAGVCLLEEDGQGVGVRFLTVQLGT